MHDVTLEGSKHPLAWDPILIYNVDGKNVNAK
jgi:hypothetical protein